MDPNAQNPQGENDAVKKLEQDLQNLTKQAPTSSQQTAPVMEPITQNLVTPPVVPASAPSATQMEPNVPVQESPKKGSPLMMVAIILAVVAVLAVVAYVFGAKLFTSGSNQAACTLEAKICPDGSSVGRTGPNCEFVACPTINATRIETLMTTATPSATPAESPTASPSSSPTAAP